MTLLAQNLLTKVLCDPVCLLRCPAHDDISSYSISEPPLVDDPWLPPLFLRVISAFLQLLEDGGERGKRKGVEVGGGRGLVEMEGRGRWVEKRGICSLLQI